MSVFVQGVEVFTNPTIQGTVNAGTGLTMPAFSAGGSINPSVDLTPNIGSSTLRFGYVHGNAIIVSSNAGDGYGSIDTVGIGTLALNSASATVVTTLQDSGYQSFVGHYWTGAASAVWEAWWQLDMTATTPAARLRLGFGATLGAGVLFYFYDTGVFEARRLDLNPAALSDTPGTVGPWYDVAAQTFTDNNTAQSGTAAAMVFNSFQLPTLAATNLTVTTTDAATVYIAGAPVAGTNQTITNAWALWIDAGNSRFDGNISMGANYLLFSEGRLGAWGGSGGLQIETLAGAIGPLKVSAIQITGISGVELAVNDAQISASNADAGYATFVARDTGVNVVEIARLAGAADPYFQIGRNDTGVALNAVTDMLVLQAGGGTGNEAANFGLGVSLRIGNAASEVEERGSIDLVLVTATNGSEDVRLDFNLMAAGAMNLAAQLSGAGILDVDLSSGLGAATVGLFDDYDDALVLRQAISQRQIGVLESLGIAHRKDTGSGWMLSVQPFLYLLAGGIYQTRQMIEDLLAEKDRQITTLEHRLAVLEGTRADQETGGIT